MSRISPGNIIAAAFLAQIAVTLIVSLGTALRQAENRIWTSRASQVNENGPIYKFLAIAAVITLLLLSLTDAFSPLWVPTMRDFQYGGIPWGSAILWVWISDILLIGWLVGYTGGSRTSPFTPLFFVFPTIALFLHEPGWRIFLYAALVVNLFTFCLFIPVNEDQQNKSSFWLVSAASFALTTATGFFTRP